MGKASARQDEHKIVVISRRFLHCGCLFGCIKRSVPIDPEPGMTDVDVGRGAIQAGGSIAGSVGRAFAQPT